MGWGSRRWAKLAWAAVAALGLAALPAIAATNAAEGGNEKSGGTERGIRFGIDREEYDAQARAAMVELEPEGVHGGGLHGASPRFPFDAPSWRKRCGISRNPRNAESAPRQLAAGDTFRGGEFAGLRGRIRAMTPHAALLRFARSVGSSVAAGSIALVACLGASLGSVE